jgi:parallel beta-helix repeat protein
MNPRQYPIVIVILILTLTLSVRTTGAEGLRASDQAGVDLIPFGTAFAHQDALSDKGFPPLGGLGNGPAAPTAAIIVSSNLDIATAGDGLCTLREAIINANNDSDATAGDCAAGSGTDTILFSVGAISSTQTISPTGALPPITAPVVIDGWSQGGSNYTGPPLIELDGSGAGSGARGLDIRGGSSIVRGLVVNGFSCDGIRLYDGDGNWVYANHIGTDVSGTAARPNNTGGGCGGGVAIRDSVKPSENNVIGTNGDGVDDPLESNLISGNNFYGIQTDTNDNRIAGNLIGLDVTGTSDLGNTSQGVIVQSGAVTNTIGTDGNGVGDAAEGNLISGNDGGGVYITNSSNTVIAGNYIGTDVHGTGDLGNHSEGVYIGGSSNNRIGTDGDGISDVLERNVISGNGSNGVYVYGNSSDDNFVAGNYIGVDVTGAVVLPNDGTGVRLDDADRNIIGTDGDGVADGLEGNIISGNGDSVSALHYNSGISLYTNASANVIAGNIIGSDVGGTVDLGNYGYGIFVQQNSDGIIGTDGDGLADAAESNLISGNRYGIYEGGSGSLTHNYTVVGNLIGTQADGVSPLGNSQGGIYLQSADTFAIRENTIAHNGGDGIFLYDWTISNTVSANSIFSNTDLGIDLQSPGGVTPNDSDDGDTGANNLQNYPVIGDVLNLPESVTIIGTLNSISDTVYTLEFFSNAVCDPSGNGEGETYLGSDIVVTDSGGDIDFTIALAAAVPEGRFVTATATDPGGNTSEFSACFGPTGPVPDVPISGLTAANDGPTMWGQPTTLFAAATSGTNIVYTWDPGDGSGPAVGDVITYTYLASGIYTATVTASNNEGATQARTTVSILPAGTIRGRVWDDLDGDRFFGKGESGIAGVEVAVSHVGTVTTDGSGYWQAASLSPGAYTVVITPSLGYVTDYPVRVVALAADGFTIVDFPMVEEPSGGVFHVRGHVWSDIDGDGLPDPDEPPIADHTVQLLPAGATATTDADGLYAFDNLTTTLGARTVVADAPADHTPDALSVDIRPRRGELQTAHLPFTALGSIVGQVSGPINTAVNRTLTLMGDGAITTQTDSQGFYRFDGVAGGYYELMLEAPAGYFVSGPDSREFAFSGGTQVENWQLVRGGSLSLFTNFQLGSATRPIGGVPIRLVNGEGYSQTHVTNPNGYVNLYNLDPAVYTAKSLVDQMGNGIVSSPAVRRNLVVHPDGGTAGSFALSAAQTVLAICRSYSANPNFPGSGFDCEVEIRALDSMFAYETSVSATAPERIIGLAAPGTYTVTLKMADARFTDWPDHTETVVLNASSPAAEVRYPYSLSAAQRTIEGYAFLDTNGNGLRDYEPFLTNERNADVADGLLVTLYDISGTLVTTATTARQNSSSTGYFSFSDLDFGEYRLAFSLPPGIGNTVYVPTTPLEQFATVAVTGYGFLRDYNFGFEPFCDDCISGRVFFDDGDGIYDAANDSPYPGQTIILHEPTGGQQTATTDDSGFYRFDDLTSLSNYQVELDWQSTEQPPTTLVREAVPGIAGLARIDFPLTAVDYTPRAIVFYDTDLSGAYSGYRDPRVGGVTVNLLDGYCYPDNDNVVESQVSAADGTITFTTVVPDGGCLRADPATLPPGVVPFRPIIGTPVAPLDNSPRGVPLIPDGRTLLVQPFWDKDGNGQLNGDETVYPEMIDVRVNQTIRRYVRENGALFILPPGTYSVVLATVPAGMEVTINQPVSVNITDESVVLHRIPMRYAGRINGTMDRSGLGPVGFSGVPVQLYNAEGGGLVATAVAATTRGGLASFSFANLQDGTYRLTVPTSSLPDGYRLAEEPLVVFSAGDTVQQNLTLVPLGDVTGRIYWDGNFNGRYDAGEGSPNIYDVVLVDEDGGQTVVTPAADGTFRFQDLQPGVRYNLTVPALLQIQPGSGVLRNTITESPGWFTVDMANVSMNIGIGPWDPSNPASEAYGQVFVRNGTARQPVPGAVVGYYEPQPGVLCDQTSPSILGQTTTDLDGNYLLNMVFQPIDYLNYCVAVVDAPGYEQVNTVLADGSYCWRTPGQEPLYCAPTANIGTDVEVAPVTVRRALAPASAIARWAAFRDGNVNGVWDDGEQALPGAIVAGDGVSATSGVDGYAELAGLADGEHVLAVTPPPGYALVGPAPTAWIEGADVNLPASGFRLDGWLVGSAFVDEDGDGWQASDERGIGGVSVHLTGPAPDTVVISSSVSGRFYATDLPDGTYTLTVGVPAGFVPVPPQTIQMEDGGVVHIPLQALDQVSGVLYQDWDGDGWRSPAEPKAVTPLTVTLTGFTDTIAHGGHFLFWRVPSGTYELFPFWNAVQPVSVMMGGDKGGALALPAVPGDQVRGIAWFDADTDGLRQPWETPLAGISVTLDGTLTTTTDEDGRFQFIGVVSGTHTLAAGLPDGLGAAIPAAKTTSARGVAVGIAAISNTAPIADAGSDRTVGVGVLVTLDGSGSTDPDGNLPLTYGWQQTGGTLGLVSLSDPNVVSPTFTAPDIAGPFTFTLVVTDSLGLAGAPDEVVVTVETGHIIHLPLVLRDRG